MSFRFNCTKLVHKGTTSYSIMVDAGDFESSCDVIMEAASHYYVLSHLNREFLIPVKSLGDDERKTTAILRYVEDEEILDLIEKLKESANCLEVRERRINE